MEHHPDKAMVGIDCPKERERIEEHFKLVQEAYETLSDPSKRREFDSVDEFDDSLPTDCAPADFFKVCASGLCKPMLLGCKRCIFLKLVSCSTIGF